MNKVILAILMSITLVACSDERSTPDGQIRDYNKCIANGMNAKLGYGDKINCYPKEQITSLADLDKFLKERDNE